MMETKVFMGYEIPTDIGYEVFPAYVSVHRRNSAEGVWDLLGIIPKPYTAQSQAWWKTEFEKITGKQKKQS